MTFVSVDQPELYIMETETEQPWEQYCPGSLGSLRKQSPKAERFLNIELCSNQPQDWALFL